MIHLLVCTWADLRENWFYIFHKYQVDINGGPNDQEPRDPKKTLKCGIMILLPYSRLFTWGATFTDVFSLTRAGYFH